MHKAQMTRSEKRPRKSAAATRTRVNGKMRSRKGISGTGSLRRLPPRVRKIGSGRKQSVQIRTDPSGFGAKEAEAPHFIEESCTFKAEPCRSAVWSADNPICGLQSLQNMLALNFREGATSAGIPC